MECDVCVSLVWYQKDQANLNGQCGLVAHSRRKLKWHLETAFVAISRPFQRSSVGAYVMPPFNSISITTREDVATRRPVPRRDAELPPQSVLLPDKLVRWGTGPCERPV